MKVTVLGSGVSGREDRRPPGFLVEFGAEKVLFECSEGIRFALNEIDCDYSDLKHFVLSHGHPDHFAFTHLVHSIYNHRQHQNRPKNPELNLYWPDSVADGFSTNWDYYMAGFKEKQLRWSKLNFYRMTTTREVRQKNFVFKSFPVYHSFGQIEALAFRLETAEGLFVYSGDTGLCQGVFEAAKGADLFVCEASARVGERQAFGKGYGHLSPFEAGQVAKQANVKKLILFHYTGFDSDEKILSDCRESGFAGEVIIGKDSQEILL